MIRNILFSLLCAMGVLASAVSPNLLFEADYNSYETQANYAKGDARSYNFPESDLQLRMYPGIKTPNSLLISNSERISYKALKNFNPSAGTVSMWLQMTDYDLGDGKLQSFFHLQSMIGKKWPDAFYFRIIKNGKEWKNFIIAQIHYKTPAMPKPFHQQVQYCLGPGKWEKGSWHHIAVTWNNNAICMYLDGVLYPETVYRWAGRQDSSGKGIPFDFPMRKYNMDIPRDIFTKSTRFFIGNIFRTADKKLKTAFDRVRIYDRPLSAAEIRKMYEAVIPPAVKKHRPHFAGIPFTDCPEEAVRCYMMMPMAKPNLRIHAYADLRRTEDDLVVKFVSDYPCGPQQKTERDGAIWEDDSFELHLEAPDSTLYQFIINGKGTILDSRNKKKVWNLKNLRKKVTHDAQGWSAELLIPLAELTSLDGLWKMDVCCMAATGRKKNYYRWSNIIFDNGFTATGEMRFLPKGKWFAPRTVGNLEQGQLDLSVASSPSVRTSASYLHMNGQKVEYPGNLGNNVWQTNLPSGNQTLQLKAVAGKELLYRYSADYYVNFPMEITFNTVYDRKKIDVKMNFANAGEKILMKIAREGISGTVKMMNKEGKIIASGTFTTKNPQCKVSLAFPKNITTGSYKIAVQADHLSHQIDYRVPNMAPYLEKVGDDDTVPPPWTPVKKLTSKKFQVWNRVYEFDGASPFPVQVTAGGNSLLLQPVVLIMKGLKPQWKPWKIREQRRDRFIFSGNGNIGGIPLAFTSELWFDGMYRINWNLNPSRTVELEDLKITYRMPEQFARYAFNPEHIPWKNHQVAVSLLPDASSRKNNVLWLSGLDRGFFFWVKSNANWILKDNHSPLTARQNSKAVDISLNIIARPVKLTGIAAYEMVFQATPSRPLPKNFREINYLSYGRCKETHYELGNTGNCSGRRDDASVTSGCYPRDFKAFTQHWKNRNVKIHMYSTPGNLSDYAEDFDFWNKDNLSVPGTVSVSYGLGVKQTTHLFCHNATDAPADLWSWWCKEAMTRLRNYNGLYFDLSAVKYCENTAHGCAGTDAFGQHFISNDAMGRRNFFLRCYKTCHKYGGDMMIHCHVSFMPMTHICDFFAPGENTCSIFKDNFYYGYCENIPLTDFLTDYNQFRSGVSYQFIMQPGRAAQITASMKEERKTWRKDRELAIHTMTPLIVHDISFWGHYVDTRVIDQWWTLKKNICLKDAVRYHGYWENDAVVSQSPRTYAGWYEWKGKAPYKRVIIAGNLTRNAQKAALKINFKKMGLDEEKTSFFDLWNNRPLTREELDQYVLKGAHFMVIGLN